MRRDRIQRATEAERAEEEQEEEEKAPPPAPADLYGELDRLHQAGNHAVARLIARQRADAPVASPDRPINLFAGLGTADIAAQMARQDEVRRRLEPQIRAYVEQQRVNINLRLPDRISMPEIVDMVRTNVPGATELDPSQVAAIVQAVFGGVRIPEHRRDRGGIDEELTARVRNALPSIPRELTIVEGPGGSLRVTMSGVEGSVRAGGAEISGSAGPGGAEASVEAGGVTVTAGAGRESASVGVRTGQVEVSGSAAYAGNEFGIEGRVGAVHFAGSVGRNDRGEWTNWSAQIGLGSIDPSQPDVEALTQTVTAAGNAMTEIVRLVHSGASPDDPRLAQHFESVKSAMSGLSRVQREREQRPGVSFGVRAEGSDGEVRAMATVTIRF